MTDRDWYPNNMDERAAWHLNFSDKLIAMFATKYNISLADQTRVNEDAQWFQWIVNARHDVTSFSQQVTKYFNDIAGNDPTKEAPEALVFDLSAPPGEPKPGIEFRTREWARQIKGSKVYSEADGEAMGIVAPESGGAPVAPSIVVTPADSGYLFSVVVSNRSGSDQWECFVRPAGATPWHSMGSKTGKSADFTYVPTTTGDDPAPVQLQVRVQLKKNDADFAPPSDIVLTTVNP